MASSSFRPPPSTCKTNDVFISFRGKDTRTRFTDHLYKALKDESIRVFRDDSGLERGNTIWEELVKVTKTSRIAIIVFSKNYANSRWCLDELVVIMDCRSSTNKCRCNQTLTVLPVFYEVSPSEVREQKGNFAEVPPDFPEDREKKWTKALTDSADLSGFPLEKDRQLNFYLYLRSESKSMEQIVETILKTLYGESLSAVPAGSESNVRRDSVAITPDASPQRTTKANKCACSACGIITLCIVVLFIFIYRGSYYCYGFIV